MSGQCGAVQGGGAVWEGVVLSEDRCCPGGYVL